MIAFKIVAIIGLVIMAIGFGLLVYVNDHFTIEETLMFERIGKIVLFVGWCILILGTLLS